jgi:hypothetical protein
MLASTATQQKAAYLLLISAAFRIATLGDESAATILNSCRQAVIKDMTLPTLIESQELAGLLIWPRY